MKLCPCVGVLEIGFKRGAWTRLLWSLLHADKLFLLSGPLRLLGGCQGECTTVSGILSAAEVGRTVQTKNISPGYDEKAAVKWITWHSDQ
jgi:hypothetical protein